MWRMLLTVALGIGSGGAYPLRRESGRGVMDVLASIDGVLDKEIKVLQAASSSSDASRFAISGSGTSSSSVFIRLLPFFVRFFFNDGFSFTGIC